MTRTLHAWLEGVYAGRFTRDSTGLVQFQYHTVTSTPSISLSLPREGKPSRRAAGNFLENLLPDHLHIRKQMADAYGIETTDTFDLLEVAGGDVAGGLLLSAHEVQPTADPLILDPATDGDIAARIAAIKRTPDAWIGSRSPARFSLAGTQGKFALSQVGEEWYWSNATVPSTHILKPARPNLPGLEAAEAAALGLAAETGIGAPPAQVLRIKDQTTYVVERFDRDRSGQIAARIHTEDLAQAMGKGPDDKYGVTAAQVIQLLRQRVGIDAAYAFIGQLAFNTFIGNADAHAKNYSLMIRPDGISLTPMYDIVPVGLYPAFDQKLAMRIGGAQRAPEVGLQHWRKLARTTSLDEERVDTIVTGLARSIAEAIDSTTLGLEPAQAARLRELIHRNVDRFS
ncbi:HipA domain-containing protein [Nocardia vermiculata]|uniref:Type II toxin-antitoxin system HipA family toxin n=1 Tax=Nocardia vermiculata TaxID=257274 RepID=A0A846XTV4_9NOCA|nr:HipA domain-containing protein [Nocardia vermiculata]NKY50536.1 type II toxin-antitoxin system HipA family toxin [Nocardia vermiculata]